MAARSGFFSAGLNVNDTIALQGATPKLQITGMAGTAAGPTIEFRNPGGTPTAPTAAGASMSIVASGYTGSAFEPGARIDVIGVGTWSPTSGGAGLYFSTRDRATAGSPIRMAIQDNGNVAIGNVGVFGGDKLHVYGDIRVGSSGNSLGCVKSALGAQIAGSCSSDVRFKRDVTPFEPMLDAVSRLTPVRYFWRADEFPNKGFGAARTYGLVAQDVESVLPELVTTDDDGYKRVDYSELPLLAIQAIGELKRDNDVLRAELAELRAAIASLQR